MKKFILILLGIISLLGIVWINKLYFIDNIESYHNILSKFILLLRIYIFVIAVQISIRKNKYLNLNMYLILVGLTYYTSYIYFLRSVDNTATINMTYAISPFFYFGLLIICILIKTKRI